MTKSLAAGIDPRMKSDSAKYDAMAWLEYGFENDKQAMYASDAYKLLDQALSGSKGQ